MRRSDPVRDFFETHPPHAPFSDLLRPDPFTRVFRARDAAWAAALRRMPLGRGETLLDVGGADGVIADRMHALRGTRGVVIDIAFRGLFDQVARAHLAVRIVYIVSQPTADWSGPVGHIDAAFIDRHVPDVMAPRFYAAGPQAMVEAMGEALGQLGVQRERIQQEIFPGYTP